MAEYTIYKFRESGTTSTLFDTSVETQVQSYINDRSSFKPGKMICYKKLLETMPDSYVLGLVYDEDGKYDIEVGVGGAITKNELKRGVYGFDNACARELAEETQFSLNAEHLHHVQHLRIGGTKRGISYLIPAQALQQLKTVLVPSPNQLDDPQRRRIDTYIFGTREEIEAIARSARTLENGIIGYTVLKFSDLKVPKAKAEWFSPKPDEIELKNIGKTTSTEDLKWLEDYWGIPGANKTTDTSVILKKKDDTKWLEKYWEVPGMKKSGEPGVKMVEFLDETNNVQNLLLKVFLKKVDPKTVKSVRYYEA